jgi:NTE family protein
MQIARSLVLALASIMIAGSAAIPARADDSSASTTITTKTTKTTTAKTTTTRQASVSTSGHHPKIGLALGGGGSRGSAHVGVLRVLLEEGVPIDVIAGTSIGSVVGGFYAAGVSVDELDDQYQNDTFIKEFMPMPLPVRLVLEPIIFVPRILGYHPYDGLYKGKKFRRYADKLSGHTKIEELPIPFAAVVTDVVSGASTRLTSGDLGTALQASTAVPGLKKPVQIGDHLYCDGGLICNLPTKHVREMGADFVIAVNIDEYLNDVPLRTFRKAGSMSTQALKIQLAVSDDALAKEAEISVHPDTTGITLISRKRSDAERGIDAGVKAAREAMPEIRRKLEALGVKLHPPVPSKVSSSSDDSTK